MEVGVGGGLMVTLMGSDGCVGCDNNLTEFAGVVM